MSTIASARPFLDRGLEKLDPRRKVEHLSSSLAQASLAQFGRRTTPNKNMEIRIIAPTDLVLKSFYNPVGSHLARPCFNQSYSDDSTVSRTSSGSSSHSSQSSASYPRSEQARNFKLPGLKRKPVPSYAPEVEETKPAVPEKDVVEESQTTASTIDIPSQDAEVSPKEEQAERCPASDSSEASSYSHSLLSTRDSISSLSSFASEERAPIKKTKSTTSLESGRSSSEDSVSGQMGDHLEPCSFPVPVASRSSSRRCMMSKRKPVPYSDVAVRRKSIADADTSFASGNALGLSSDGEGQDAPAAVVEKPAPVKKVSKKSNMSSKKLILASAASASKEQKRISSRRVSSSSMEPASPTLSECSFHTAGEEEEDGKPVQKTSVHKIQAQLYIHNHPSRTSLHSSSPSLKSKKVPFVVPPRRLDASLQSDQSSGSSDNSPRTSCSMESTHSLDSIRKVPARGSYNKNVRIIDGRLISSALAV